MSQTNQAGAIQVGSAARVAAVIVALGLTAGGLCACNTINGAGKDVSAAGNAVTGTSQATQEKLPDSPKP